MLTHANANAIRYRHQLIGDSLVYVGHERVLLYTRVATEHPEYHVSAARLHSMLELTVISPKRPGHHTPCVQPQSNEYCRDQRRDYTRYHDGRSARLRIRRSCRHGRSDSKSTLLRIEGAGQIVVALISAAAEMPALSRHAKEGEEGPCSAIYRWAIAQPLWPDQA